MKILHTADIHIRQYDDDRWKALQQIIELGKKENIDVLVISGDLFDSDVDAGKLRTGFRELFAEGAFPVIIIPGNHDAASYPEGIFLGEEVTIIRDYRQPVIRKNVHFWGLPFEDLKEDEVFPRLHQASSLATAEGMHILLFHGELLDITGAWENYGEEGQRRYMPVKLSYFQYLNWNYVLAGHFHTNFDVHEFKKNHFFVYPGSPVSITRRETGPRKVNLFEVGTIPAEYELPTPYFEPLEIILDPFREISPVRVIREKLSKLPEYARILVKVSGYYDSKKLGMTEQELHQMIKKEAGERAESLELGFRDIHEILEDDLFRAFDTKLKQRGLSEEEMEKIRQVTIKAMMEMG